MVHSQLILFRAFAQRASTAFRASSERCLAGIFSQPRFSARFRPPFQPMVSWVSPLAKDTTLAPESST